MSLPDLSLTLDGIRGADSSYFVIGGAVLVVYAGMFGFKMLLRLIGEKAGLPTRPDTYDRDSYHASRKI